jgi:hypothetical protein
MKTELGPTIQVIAQRQLMTIGELHKWSDNEYVPGHIVRAALQEMLEVHSAMKTILPVCLKVDDLLGELTKNFDENGKPKAG